MINADISQERIETLVRDLHKAAEVTLDDGCLYGAAYMLKALRLALDEITIEYDALKEQMIRENRETLKEAISIVQNIRFGEKERQSGRTFRQVVIDALSTEKLEDSTNSKVYEKK